MRDMSAIAMVGGSSLRRLIYEVKNEFAARAAFDEFDCNFRQANCVRVVALDVFERKAPAEQIAVVADLMRSNAELTLIRGDKAEVFASADSPAEIILDLVCEVVWQTLMCDDAVRVEDEIRLALAYS